MGGKDFGFKMTWPEWGKGTRLALYLMDIAVSLDSGSTFLDFIALLEVTIRTQTLSAHQSYPISYDLSCIFVVFCDTQNTMRFRPSFWVRVALPIELLTHTFLLIGSSAAFFIFRCVRLPMLLETVRLSNLARRLSDLANN